MKRIPALRDLSDDHHTALVLARRCKQVTAPDASLSADAVWHQVLEAFVLQLEPHFQIEDLHLLPALDAIGERELAARVRDDHAALRAMVAVAAPNAAAVSLFGQRLEAHVRFEERQVFEVAQARLPEAALQAIAEACRSIPRVCPTSLKA